MKLRRDKKIGSELIRGPLADIFSEVAVLDTGALLIKKNERDFKPIREVDNFKYIVVG
jgi:hypothetical protein